ncbi:DEAD/DEAH box helicase family protein [Sabulicella glaciei]|uniref:DEAD/DEAH box helicase family protein n=1 Tax=Sabulicella glaciei TaxID=2984948 RepID=A0ABT3P0W2_9PROT|nr:DEAD/DEAH box helicase family protein [Roseococcus sp. MDT2-1-1]
MKIDAQLRDAGWAITDGRSIRFEHLLSDGTKADYLLCSALGRALAVVEAKRASVSLGKAEVQGEAYARLAGVPFVFLANGEEVRFRDLDHDAHFRAVAGVFSQDDLERRLATRALRRPPTSIPIDERIVERAYQHDCIEALCRGIEAGRRKFLVEMATGTGKTRTAAALIKRLFEANAVTRALFLVDRDTLAKQAEDAFVEHVPSLPAYRVGGTGARFKPEKRITVCTLQTMINEYRHYSAGYFDLIVVDECHRSIYGEYRRALDHFDAVKIGLTATPLVGKPDADPEEAAFVRDTLRFFEVTEPSYRYTLREAVEEGHLVPHRIYNARTVRTAAEGGFEVRREEIDWDALSPSDREELERLFAGADGIVVDPAALERRFTIPERNRAIVREFRDVIDRGYTGVDGVRRAPDRGKTIVFAVTKRHAETLAHLLDEAFADEKPNPTTRIADFVVSGMGADDTADAPTIIKRFKKEPFPRMLVSVNMLDTGFDGPEVVNLVMTRFTRSGVLYRQMRGRGTRRADHIRKTGFTIFDFVGNCAAHENDDALPGGVIMEAPKAAKPGPPRRLVTLDIHDEIDPATREWVIWDPATDAPTDVEAEAGARLAARFEAFLAGEDLGAEAQRWAGMMAEQLRSDGAAMVSFSATRFSRPPFSLRGGLAAGEAAFGGAEALSGFLARMNTVVFGGARAPGTGEGARA